MNIPLSGLMRLIGNAGHTVVNDVGHGVGTAYNGVRQGLYNLGIGAGSGQFEGALPPKTVIDPNSGKTVAYNPNQSANYVSPQLSHGPVMNFNTAHWNDPKQTPQQPTAGQYAANPQSPQFTGVDPAQFGYPADNTVQPTNIGR